MPPHHVTDDSCHPVMSLTTHATRETSHALPCHAYNLPACLPLTFASGHLSLFHPWLHTGHWWSHTGGGGGGRVCAPSLCLVHLPWSWGTKELIRWSHCHLVVAWPSAVSHARAPAHRPCLDPACMYHIPEHEHTGHACLDPTDIIPHHVPCYAIPCHTCSCWWSTLQSRR